MTSARKHGLGLLALAVVDTAVTWLWKHDAAALPHFAVAIVVVVLLGIALILDQPLSARIAGAVSTSLALASLGYMGWALLSLTSTSIELPRGVVVCAVRYAIPLAIWESAIRAERAS